MKHQGVTPDRPRSYAVEVTTRRNTPGEPGQPPQETPHPRRVGTQLVRVEPGGHTAHTDEREATVLDALLLATALATTAVATAIAYRAGYRTGNQPSSAQPADSPGEWAESFGRVHGHVINLRMGATKEFGEDHALVALLAYGNVLAVIGAEISRVGWTDRQRRAAT